MSAPIVPQSLCFVRHPAHSWILGQVIEVGPKGTYTVKTRKGQWESKSEGGDTISKVPEADIFVYTDISLEKEEKDDLLELMILHDSLIMNILRLRYFQDIIYTKIGAILVAFNPFTYNIPWYLDECMPSYLEEGHQIEKNKPHNWAVAHETYYEMINTRANQCVLVSGESGAGKTEAAKILFRYLDKLSAKYSGSKQPEAEMSVGNKILAASPILEAFGNAKTIRNDNSSRFGKFMQVQFDNNGAIKGCHTTRYLLEKSRIIQAASDERIYHAFYLLLKSPDAKKYGLGSISSYKTVKSGNCLDIEGVDDAEDYKICREAMTKVGMNHEEQEQIWSTVAGILELQEVEFEEHEDGDECTISKKTIKRLKNAAKLWGLAEGEETILEKEFLSTTNQVRGQTIVRKLTKICATDVRDSLSRGLYQGLFTWMVDKINTTTSVKDFDMQIGVLDIFGFEDFAVNSFEQLCINLANETLQYHYNNYVFEKDIGECKAEGIDVSTISYPDNRPCLELVAGKRGIFSYLDEQCSLGNGSDANFLLAVTQDFGDHEFFERKKLGHSSFIIKHYAGDVSYEVEGFVDKNRDTLKDTLKVALRKSQHPLISGLLPAPVGSEAGKANKKGFVGDAYRQSLDQLMDVINSSNPHWIRCIKPHPAKKPSMFHGPKVLQQLSCAGVLGTVRVRKAGYPIRMKLADFLNRNHLLIGAKRKTMDPGKCCTQFLYETMKINPKLAQVGTRRVFLKTEVYIQLEKAIVEKQKVYTQLLQNMARHYSSKQRAACFMAQRKVCLIQSFCRIILGQKRMRSVQYELMRDTLEAIAKQIMGVPNEEARFRDEIEKIQEDEFSAIHMEWVPVREKIMEMWNVWKNARDMQIRNAMLHEDFEARMLIVDVEIEEWHELLDYAEHSWANALKLNQERLKMMRLKIRMREQAQLDKYRVVAMALWDEMIMEEKTTMAIENSKRLDMQDRWSRAKDEYFTMASSERENQIRERHLYPGKDFRVFAKEDPLTSSQTPTKTKGHQPWDGSDTGSQYGSMMLSPRSVKSALSPRQQSPRSGGRRNRHGSDAISWTVSESESSQSPPLRAAVDADLAASFSRGIYSLNPDPLRHRSQGYIQECFSIGPPPKPVPSVHATHQKKVSVDPRKASTHNMLEALKNLKKATKSARDIPHTLPITDPNNPLNPVNKDWRPHSMTSIIMPDHSIAQIHPIELEYSDEEEENY